MNVLGKLINWLFGEKEDLERLSKMPLYWGKFEFLGEFIEWALERLSYGFCITGGVGVGKSRRLLLPFLVMLLYCRYWCRTEKEWAGLILDPKLTLIAKLFTLVPGLVDRFYILGEDKDCPVNILRSSVSSQRLAELLSESRFAGKKLVQSSGSAWFESNAITGLGLLIALARLTDQKCLQTVFKMYGILVEGGSLTPKHRDAGPYLQRLQQLLSGKPDEVRQILSSIGHILQPFRDEPWYSMFCKEGDYFLSRARDEGKIMLVRISQDTAGYHSGLFLLKAMWFDTIMERLKPDFKGNALRPCLYMCDEFQKVARPGSESTFFDVRREANAVPIVAFQQLSQLQDVLGETETKTVLGLLSVKIALRNSDPETNEYFSKLSGEIDHIALSITTPSGPGLLTWKGSSATESRVRLPRIHPNFFFELPDGDGVIFEAGKKPYCAWFGDALLTPDKEEVWRKKYWPNRPNLSKPPRYLR